MDQLFCMRVFVRVVEQGAFTRAADDLGVSRSTVTTALAQLEKHLGVRLLHRTTRRLSLTDEGRSYYEGCVRILGEIAEAEDSLSSAKVSPRGRLRISIAQSFEAMGFFPLLARCSSRAG
jgi:LysR family transcriptional regulator for bpeEF and oprC